MDYKDKIWIKSMEYGRQIGCHQMESRSFIIGNYQFPVCARCTGVIIGEIIAIILILINIRANLIAILILLFPMGLDWGIQYLKIKDSTNIRRLITGILGGIGLTFFYFTIFVLFFKFGLLFILSLI